MIAVLQRVSHASVAIQAQPKAKIGLGLLVLVGIEEADTIEDVNWLASKLVNLRIFNDAAGVMNVSVKDCAGEILIVSQFTLQASTRKGNRPSYIKAARPEVAIPVYEKFIAAVQAQLTRPVQTGEFGADMQITLLNDGPVTIVIDTKNKV
ncbi:MAG: D-tyrosyl-tRNA(Tyr) deacylase [Cyclobacteriaceae bacterium]|nr:D-tyrosyl-tRNA(Tyr) deacylase [Cyclobacteriaceae bacterium]